MYDTADEFVGELVEGSDGGSLELLELVLDALTQTI